MTGFGGFSRKLFATLLVSAMMLTGSNAADNSIYIDQAGDNATISVTQDGTSNVVRGIQGVGTGNTTPAKIYGDGNQVSVSQVGSNNVLNLGINRGRQFAAEHFHESDSDFYFFFEGVLATFRLVARISFTNLPV